MTGPTRDVRDAVLRRDGGCCVACGRTVAVEDGDHMRPIAAYSLQHRRARGMGGSRDLLTNQPVNLVVLCGSATSAGGCHQYVESHPEWARTQGYRVDQSESPETVPVIVRTPDGEAVYGLDGFDRIRLYPLGGAA